MTASFRAAGLAEASLNARLLVAEACGLLPEGAITHRDFALSEDRKLRIDEFAARRLRRRACFPHSRPSRILGTYLFRSPGYSRSAPRYGTSGRNRSCTCKSPWPCKRSFTHLGLGYRVGMPARGPAFGTTASARNCGRCEPPSSHGSAGKFAAIGVASSRSVLMWRLGGGNFQRII